MKKSRRKTLRITIVMLFVLVLIVTAYYFVRVDGRIGAVKSEDKKTQTDLLIEKDIENNYPSTPKEVIELYINISKSFYNKNTTDEELSKLSSQIRLLFDEELLEENPLEEYLLNLKSEVDQFRKNKLSIMNYLTDDKSEVEFWTYKEKEYASRIVTYTIKEESDYTKVYNDFVLRKSNDGQWKILGWTKIDQPSQDK